MKRSSNLIGASNRKAFIGRMARAADCGGRATRAAIRALGPDDNYLRMLRIRNGLNADTAHILSRMNTRESLGQTEADRLARERSARVSSELDTLSGAIPRLDATGIDSLTEWLNKSSVGPAIGTREIPSEVDGDPDAVRRLYGETGRTSAARYYIPGGSKPGGLVTRVVSPSTGLNYGYVVGGSGPRGVYNESYSPGGSPNETLLGNLLRSELNKDTTPRLPSPEDLRKIRNTPLLI